MIMYKIWYFDTVQCMVHSLSFAQQVVGYYVRNHGEHPENYTIEEVYCESI